MSNNLIVPGLIADVDLSEKKGYVATMLSTSSYGTPKVGLCSATLIPLGIIVQPGIQDEDNVSVVFSGYVAEAVLGGTVAQNDLLKSDANGTLVTTGDGSSTEDEIIIAQAMKGGVSGDMVPVLVGRFIN